MIPENTFPQDVVESWPEIYGDITLNVMPLEYVNLLTITFKNKTVWQIQTRNVANSGVSIKDTLIGVIGFYEDDIDNLDFKLDILRIKKDIVKYTRRFLKSIK